MFKSTAEVLSLVKNAERNIALRLWERSFDLQRNARFAVDADTACKLRDQSDRVLRIAKAKYDAAELLLISEFSNN